MAAASPQALYGRAVHSDGKVSSRARARVIPPPCLPECCCHSACWDWKRWTSVSTGPNEPRFFGSPDWLAARTAHWICRKTDGVTVLSDALYALASAWRLSMLARRRSARGPAGGDQC